MFRRLLGTGSGEQTGRVAPLNQLSKIAIDRIDGTRIIDGVAAAVALYDTANDISF